MINPENIYHTFIDESIDFFAGVPDSLLKHLCAVISSRDDQHQHVIAANEGGAVAAVAGFHLATGRVGMVYMQNSGLGNAVNPFTSLTHGDVYRIPMVVVIGWRGEPGVKDEPQHRVKGAITISLLETMGISYEVLPEDEEKAVATVRRVATRAREHGTPIALIVREGTFSPCDHKASIEGNYPLTREEALKTLLERFEDEAVIVSTTGKLSRELYELREARGEGHHYDFLTVGSMGHASQIALGIALAKPTRPVYCLDGDGAAIMHLGGLSIIGHKQPANLRHVLFNNGAHESVGGQPTAGFAIDFCGIAQSCRYPLVRRAKTEQEITEGITAIQGSRGLGFLEIMVALGSRKDLGRPQTTPVENKEGFMKHLDDRWSSYSRVQIKR